MTERPIRYNLVPEKSEGLDVGTKSKRFRSIRARHIEGDTLVLGGYAIRVVNGKLEVELLQA